MTTFNKSPEPTAVGAGGSAFAVHAASRRWLSYEGIGVVSKLSTFGLDCVGILLTRFLVLWQSPRRDFDVCFHL
jgi:hypothetical protein